MKDALIRILAMVAAWLISAGFIYWGWTVIVKYTNLPSLTYWEVFAVRMAVSCFMAIFWQRNNKE